MTTANEYFAKKNPTIALRETKLRKLLGKARLQHELMGERLEKAWNAKCYDRTHELFNLENAIIRELKNIERMFDLFCSKELYLY